MHVLQRLPGVPESALPDDVAARLPASTPGPPWDCRIRGTVWLQHGRPPLADPAYAGRALPITVAAVVEYLDSPVGGYREVFAGPLLRRAGLVLHVPFMAVDSAPSLHGGRSHWALPKTLADFTADADDVTAQGDGWRMTARTRAFGPAVPLVLRMRTSQAGRDARMVLRARTRPARVRVEATGPSLTAWLGSGTHAGVVGEGRMVLGPPQPRSVRG